MLDRFVVLLIDLYQRFLSPYKGYRCAHARYHGGASCSGAVKRIVIEQGVVHGAPLIRQRFRDCHMAYMAIASDDSGQGDRPGGSEPSGKPARRKRDDRQVHPCSGKDANPAWVECCACVDILTIFFN